jgi:hypothetical protein
MSFLEVTTMNAKAYRDFRNACKKIHNAVASPCEIVFDESTLTVSCGSESLEMAKLEMSRLCFDILSYVCDHGRTTYKELGKYFGKSVSTISRLCRQISFNAPITFSDAGLGVFNFKGTFRFDYHPLYYVNI